MSSEELYRFTATLILIVFTLLIFTSAVLTLTRIAVYRANGVPRPRLLTRDGIVIGGLAVPFLLISVARVLGFVPIDQVWWVLLTGIPGLFAMGTYIYYEVFVIDRQVTDRDETTHD